MKPINYYLKVFDNCSFSFFLIISDCIEVVVISVIS